MIIDFHCHLGTDVEGTNLHHKKLLDISKKNGVSKIVAFPFNSSDEDLINNSLKILELSKENQEIIPFLRFNPKTISKERLVELLKKSFKGIKFHSVAQKFNPSDESIAWVYELINQFSLPIIFHNKIHQLDGNPKEILKIAPKYKNVNFVIGHFFGDDFSIIDEIKKHSNVFTETSIYARTKRIENIVNKHKFENILLGSDSPYDNQEISILKIKKSEISEEMKKKILYKNAQKILKLNE